VCTCGVALVNKHNIEMMSSFHTLNVRENVFTCLFVGLFICLSMEFSSVS